MDSSILLLVAALLLASGIVFAAILVTRRGKPSEEEGLGATLSSLTAAQQNLFNRMSELSGAIGQISQDQATRHSEFAKQINDRLDAVSKRVGDTLTDQGQKTAESLGQLQQRLSTIDEAQKNIVELSGQVVSLQDILSNKQARGAWGQDRMEDIITDQLPPDLYQFRAKLSNNTEPDCIIRIPSMSAAIVIDAKFPLEAFEAYGRSSTDSERKTASAQLRSDVLKHVNDIARKYLIPGEVQTPALMFVPSESIYADLQQAFPDVVQRARRAQVVIVSPHILWLAVNTIRTLMRDAKMREQADTLQKEVGLLLQDVKLMAKRVVDLRKHFETTSGDIGEIEKPMNRISSRAAKIEAVELAEPDSIPQIPAA